MSCAVARGRHGEYEHNTVTLSKLKRIAKNQAPSTEGIHAAALMAVLEAAEAAAKKGDAGKINLLVKTLYKKAESLEKEHARQAKKAVRDALSRQKQRSLPGLGRALARRAFQWVKSERGWAKATVRNASTEDAVPDAGLEVEDLRETDRDDEGTDDPIAPVG